MAAGPSSSTYVSEPIQAGVQPNPSVESKIEEKLHFIRDIFTALSELGHEKTDRYKMVSCSRTEDMSDAALSGPISFRVVDITGKSRDELLAEEAEIINSLSITILISLKDIEENLCSKKNLNQRTFDAFNQTKKDIEENIAKLMIAKDHSKSPLFVNLGGSDNDLKCKLRGMFFLKKDDIIRNVKSIYKTFKLTKYKLNSIDEKIKRLEMDAIEEATTKIKLFLSGYKTLPAEGKTELLKDIGESLSKIKFISSSTEAHLLSLMHPLINIMREPGDPMNLEISIMMAGHILRIFGMEKLSKLPSDIGKYIINDINEALSGHIIPLFGQNLFNESDEINPGLKKEIIDVTGRIQEQFAYFDRRSVKKNLSNLVAADVITKDEHILIQATFHGLNKLSKKFNEIINGNNTINTRTISNYLSEISHLAWKTDEFKKIGDKIIAYCDLHKTEYPLEFRNSIFRFHVLGGQIISRLPLLFNQIPVKEPKTPLNILSDYFRWRLTIFNALQDVIESS